MTEQSLIISAMKYFERIGYTIEYNTIIAGSSGNPQAFDFLLRKGDDVRLVYVKDWARSVGVNMVIKIDKTSEDMGIRRPFFVAKSFSDHAYAYSKRHSITLLTLRELTE